MHPFPRTAKHFTKLTLTADNIKVWPVIKKLFQTISDWERFRNLWTHQSSSLGNSAANWDQLNLHPFKFMLKPQRFFCDSPDRDPIIPSCVAVQCSLSDLQSQPLIDMINAANSAHRCSSTTQVAAPAGLSHVTLHSRATLWPYRNQPPYTEHMAYFTSAAPNSRNISSDTLACFDLPFLFSQLLCGNLDETLLW